MYSHRFFDKKCGIATLLFIVLLSRLPFLFNGYGLDGDGWHMVQSGYDLAFNGIYHTSRFPGYPLPEFILGLIWLLKLPFTIPFIFNFITAVFSIAAVYYFFMISERFINKSKPIVYLSTIAFALTPVIYINSTVTMDYIPALAFILGSLYYLISGRNVLSAFFLGLAVGCRITSSLLIIPVIYYLISEKENHNSKAKDILIYIMILSGISLMFFLPLIINYGISFLTYYSSPDQYSLIKITGRMTLRTWGAVGSVGILLSLIYFFLNNKKSIVGLFKTKSDVFILISAAIYLLLYFWLPLDAGYLIPFVAFLLLLLYKILSRRTGIFLSIFILASPFILNIEKNDVMLAGPVIIDMQKRAANEEYVNLVIKKARELNKPSLIICETYLHKIEVMMALHKAPFPEYTRFINTISYDSLKLIIQRNNPDIYYLKDVREQTLVIYNYDLKSFGAKEIN